MSFEKVLVNFLVPTLRILLVGYWLFYVLWLICLHLCSCFFNQLFSFQLFSWNLMDVIDRKIGWLECCDLWVLEVKPPTPDFHVLTLSLHFCSWRLEKKFHSFHEIIVCNFFGIVVGKARVWILHFYVKSWEESQETMCALCQTIPCTYHSEDQITGLVYLGSIALIC